MNRTVISILAVILAALVGWGFAQWTAQDYTYYTSAFEYSEPEAKHDEIKLDSEILAEQRVINVSLPPSYAQSPDRSYPVLYMPDGGMSEDFSHIVYTVRQLADEGNIPELIVVGIENTKRQRDLTGPTTVETDKLVADEIGKVDNFRKFITEELKPRIEKDYRCQGPTTLIGESLAGYFVVETALRSPEMFDYYVALSPSLWWNDHQLVQDSAELALNVPADRRLFLSSANETDIYPHAAALAESLKSQATPFAWTYHPRMDLSHQTIFRAMKREGLTWVFANSAAEKETDLVSGENVP